MSLNINQSEEPWKSWEVLLDHESVTHILLDVTKDRKMIAWLKTQPEWGIDSLSGGLILFRRNLQGQIPPQEVFDNSSTRGVFNPPFCLLMSLLLMLVIKWVVPTSATIPFPWNLLGFIPLGIGIIINIVADQQFKRARTTVKPERRSTALITNGLYKITRNPMYLGMVLILIGVATALGSWISFMIPLAFAVLMNYRYIQREENHLKFQFGRAWEGYQQNTPRWI
jgi:protein-S-isoprenylcysteine O-methyltransferase Ste14